MLKKRGNLLIGVLLVALVAGFLLWRGIGKRAETEDIAQQELETAAELLYGIDYSGLAVEEGVIRSGQTISSIFNGYGISPAVVDRTAKAADSVFSLRNIRAGRNYMAFLTEDSLPRLVHFVYEHTLTDFLVISLQGDSIEVRREQKDVDIVRRRGTAEINSSLWNAVVGAGMPASLSMELEEVYQWTIDFFGLQKEDKFTVIYEEKYVDTTSVGIGRIWGLFSPTAAKNTTPYPSTREVR